MANYRSEKINDAVREALSVIIRDVKDPRVAGNFVSITGAEVSGDLKYATVYWSSLVTRDDPAGAAGDRQKEKEITAGLRSSAAYMRRRLAAEVNLRVTPELQFRHDRSISNGAHISALLRKIGEEEESRAAGNTGSAGEGGLKEKEDGNRAGGKEGTP